MRAPILYYVGMKKFTLTVVIAIILFGFYHATTMIDNDVVAKNSETGFSGLKNNVTENIQPKLVDSTEDTVIKAVEDSDVSLGVPRESLSGSLMNSLLFNKDKNQYNLSSVKVDEKNEISESDNKEIIDHEKDDTNTKNKQKIIEIYKESPQIFDIEVLKEYLKGSGYTEEEYIKAICEPVE
jgi:hypothetical protein